MIRKVKSLLCSCKGKALFKMGEKLDGLCFSGCGLEALVARIKITFQKGGKIESTFVSVSVVKTLA